MASLVLGKMWMPSAGELAMLGPTWALVGTIIAVLIGAMFVGRNWRAAGAIAMIGALAAVWLSLRGLSRLDGPWSGFAAHGRSAMLIADQFSLFFALLLSVFLVMIVGMWHLGQRAGLEERLARRGDAAEFFVLLFGSAVGMTLMVSTTNLLMIILAVEMASLPSYGLAGFRKKHRPAAEAAMKYVLFGAVTSAIMIYGVSLLYGQFRTLDLSEIGRRMADQWSAGHGRPLLTGVSLAALMIGVGFKISIVPLHFWCPDVFEGASIEITTWLSVVSKAAGLGLLLRILMVVESCLESPQALRWVLTLVAVGAAVTCTVGNLSAFRQTNMKRLLAFSSIAHAGYMLMATAIFWRPVVGAGGAVHPGFSVVVAYLTIYLLMNLGAFGAVAMVYWATGRETIDAFNGLSRRSPLVAVMMAVCLFSLVGLPPLGGFMVKWYLLAALYEGGLVWLVVVAVLNTLISLYYYARVAYAMFFVDDGQAVVRAPVLGRVVIFLCAVGIVAAGTAWAGELKDYSDARSRELCVAASPTTAEEASPEFARPSRPAGATE